VEFVPESATLFGVTNERDVTIEMLSAMGWDLRALGEAQVRSLTAMQRCIDDYRKTLDLQALREVRRHISELDQRSYQTKDSFAHLLEIVTELESTHTDASETRSAD
jgi:hypothetical protein